MCSRLKRLPLLLLFYCLFFISDQCCTHSYLSPFLQNYDYIRDSVHSNYDTDDQGKMEDLNASYHSNEDLNDYMRHHGGSMENTRSSITSQYSNTPPVKNPMPSALKPSTMGNSLVLYDGGNSSNNNSGRQSGGGDRRQSEHNSSLTSLNDEQSQHQRQQQMHHGEKHKYRPPPPPRRDDDSLNGMISQDMESRNNNTTRSTSRSRNERPASRSRDVRPAPPQRTPSQPRSSSRARGNSSRGRDSSRSRPREGDSSSRPAPPPGRARSQSRSRQPSRSRGREDRSQPPPQQRPTPPVGILRKGIHSGHGSSPNLYNPKEAKDDDDSYRNISNELYNDAHSRPGPPPRSAGMPMSPPGNNRMRMEPPETPPDEIDNYSLNSRDAQRKHTVGPHPPRRGPPPQDLHQRRLTDQSGHHPNTNNRMMPQPPRSGPVFMHDHGENNSSESEHNNKAHNTTPKKGNLRRNEQPGLTESETNISDTPSANADPNDSEAPVMAQASEYDDKGRCVKHPHIKLRKKKILGGWKVMLVRVYQGLYLPRSGCFT
jgi:hypothetical protein